MVRESDYDASWVNPRQGVSGMAYREAAPGQTQDSLESLSWLGNSSVPPDELKSWSG